MSETYSNGEVTAIFICATIMGLIIMFMAFASGTITLPNKYKCEKCGTIIDSSEYKEVTTRVMEKKKQLAYNKMRGYVGL